MQRSIPPHTNTVGRQCQMLPVPVEGYPSHGVQHPEDGEIQPIEGRDITRKLSATGYIHAKERGGEEYEPQP